MMMRLRKTKQQPVRQKRKQTYTNIKGEQHHTLFCECRDCQIKPRLYRQAISKGA